MENLPSSPIGSPGSSRLDRGSKSGDISFRNQASHHSTFGFVNASDHSKVNQIGGVYAENFYSETTNLLLPTPKLAERFSNVSLQRVAHYVHRPSLDFKLKLALHDGLGELEAPKKRNSIVVVYGLGGSGKTQLVLNYIEEYRNDYEGIIWLNSGGRQSVERQMVVIYRLLFALPGSKEVDIPNFEELLIRVKNWFHGRLGHWLWIFDSADNVGIRQDLDFIDLTSLLPSAPNVQVLITTRSADVRKISRSVPVEVGSLELPEALAIFWATCELDPTEVASANIATAESIVEELGLLPLAISLAGATIHESPTMSRNLAIYLSEYKQNRKELLNKQPDWLIAQYGESILTSWEISFKILERRSIIAARLLGFLSLFDPNDIFIDLFELALRKGGLPERSTNGSDWRLALSPQYDLTIRQVEAAFTVLQSFLMVKFHKSNPEEANSAKYTMHKLVQAWGLVCLEKESRLFVCRAVTIFLAIVTDRCGGDPVENARIGKHLTKSLTETLNILDGEPPQETEPFLFDFQVCDIFLDRLGFWNTVQQVRLFLHTQMRRIFGDEHPNTILVLNNLAITLGDRGKLEEAVSVMKEVLEKMRRIFGDEHPKTISVTNNLARLLGYQGKLEEAISMSQEVLEKRRQILGDEDLSTISAMNNLASILGQQGKLEEAESILKEVLEKRRRILGDENLSTISTMNNLASMLGYQGKLEEAASMINKVLEKRRRILGDEHPKTISTMNNLASTLGRQKKPDKAVVILKEVLENMRRILGDEHPNTTLAMNNLAIALESQGNLDEAVVIQREVVRRSRHPDTNEEATIAAIGFLARLLRKQANFEELAVLETEIVSLRTRELGAQHPDTGSGITALVQTHEAQETLHGAGILWRLGELEEAALLEAEVLKKREKILGDNHPETKLARMSLAKTFGALGNAEEAVLLYRRILATAETEADTDDIVTFNAAEELGMILHSQEKVDEAEQRYRQALAGYGLLLETGHAKTLKIMRNLGSLYYWRGEFQKAEEIWTKALSDYEHSSSPSSAESGMLQVLLSLGSLYRDHCYELYKQRARGALQSRPRQDGEADRLFRKIGDMVHICKLPLSSTSLFAGLGRMLIWARKIDEALVAFEQQITRSENGSIWTDVQCDGCGRQMSVDTGRHICQSCKDIDICTKCFQKYQQGDIADSGALANCNDHSYVLVPRPEWYRLLPGTVTTDGQTLQEWLAGVETVYPPRAGLDKSNES